MVSRLYFDRFKAEGSRRKIHPVNAFLTSFQNKAV